MKNIAIVGGSSFSDEQLIRLQALGEVSEHAQPASAEELSALSKQVDVICSDGGGLYENLHALEDVFVTYPYI